MPSRFDAVHFHLAHVLRRGHFLLARCRLLGTDCFHETQQGLWFIINFCSLGGKIHYLWPACVWSTPCLISSMWEERVCPLHFSARVWDGPEASTRPSFWKLCSNPKVDFSLPVFLLLFRFWCPGRSLSHMLWRLRCKFGKGPREPVV